MWAKTARDLGQSITDFKAFVGQGLLPATAALVELKDLQETLQQTANAFSQILAMRGQLAPVLQGLSNAANISKDFEALPQRIAHIQREIERVSSELLRSQIEECDEVLAASIKKMAQAVRQEFDGNREHRGESD